MPFNGHSLYARIRTRPQAQLDDCTSIIDRSTLPPSATQNDVDSSENQTELAVSDLADSLRELALVERDDERDVCNGILG